MKVISSFSDPGCALTVGMIRRFLFLPVRSVSHGIAHQEALQAQELQDDRTLGAGVRKSTRESERERDVQEQRPQGGHI